MRHTMFTHVVDPETGRRYPIPAGGANDDPPADPPQDPPADTDPPEPADPPDPDDPEDDKGAGSKAAVLADLAKERKERQRLAKQLADREAADEKAAREAMDEHERAIAEARDQARSEVLSEVATERLNDRIRIAAARKLNDPEDAVRLLDTDGLDPSSDDLASEIEAALGKLVEDKPYLAVSETQSAGSGDARSRQDSRQPDVTQMTPAQVREWAKANR